MNSKRNHVAPYLKAECIDSIKNNIHTPSTGSKHYNIPRQTIYDWLKKANIKYIKRVTMKGNKNALKIKLDK